MLADFTNQRRIKMNEQKKKEMREAAAARIAKIVEDHFVGINPEVKRRVVQQMIDQGFLESTTNQPPKEN